MPKNALKGWSERGSEALILHGTKYGTKHGNAMELSMELGIGMLWNRTKELSWS